jgi:E1-E2 ATPase
VVGPFRTHFFPHSGEKCVRARYVGSYASIAIANTFTVFNAILAAFGAATIAFGNPEDALFLGILVANTSIGTFQEVRAKRALDRLAALVVAQATVVRDGEPRAVPLEAVVTGDLVRVAAGDQVPADGTLVRAEGLAVDESALTGESEPVVREPGEGVFAGSFAIEGEGEGEGDFEATAAGAESRAARLPRLRDRPDRSPQRHRRHRRRLRPGDRLRPGESAGEAPSRRRRPVGDDGAALLRRLRDPLQPRLLRNLPGQRRHGRRLRDRLCRLDRPSGGGAADGRAVGAGGGSGPELRLRLRASGAPGLW